MKDHTFIYLAVLFALFVAICPAQDPQAQPLLPVVPSPAQPDDPSFPLVKRRFTDYLYRVAGPPADLGIVAKASVAHAVNHPAGWAQDSDAFGKRLGWWWTENWISETTRFAVSESFRLDSTFHRSPATGVKSRIGHAIRESFVARTRGGRTIVSVPSLAAPYFGAMYSSYAWYPNCPNWKATVKTGSVTLALQPAINLLREFVFKR
jgi:hypothetical protein